MRSVYRRDVAEFGVKALHVSPIVSDLPGDALVFLRALAAAIASM